MLHHSRDLPVVSDREKISRRVAVERIVQVVHHHLPFPMLRLVGIHVVVSHQAIGVGVSNDVLESEDAHPLLYIDKVLDICRVGRACGVHRIHQRKYVTEIIGRAFRSPFRKCPTVPGQVLDAAPHSIEKKRIKTVIPAAHSAKVGRQPPDFYLAQVPIAVVWPPFLDHVSVGLLRIFIDTAPFDSVDVAIHEAAVVVRQPQFLRDQEADHLMLGGETSSVQIQGEIFTAQE